MIGIAIPVVVLFQSVIGSDYDDGGIRSDLKPHLVSIRRISDYEWLAPNIVTRVWVVSIPQGSDYNQEIVFVVLAVLDVSIHHKFDYNADHVDGHAKNIAFQSDIGPIATGGLSRSPPPTQGFNLLLVQLSRADSDQANTDEGVSIGHSPITIVEAVIDEVWVVISIRHGSDYD